MHVMKILLLFIISEIQMPVFSVSDLLENTEEPTDITPISVEKSRLSDLITNTTDDGDASNYSTVIFPNSTLTDVYESETTNESIIGSKLYYESNAQNELIDDTQNTTAKSTSMNHRTTESISTEPSSITYKVDTIQRSRIQDFKTEIPKNFKSKVYYSSMTKDSTMKTTNFINNLDIIKSPKSIELLTKYQRPLISLNKPSGIAITDKNTDKTTTSSVTKSNVSPEKNHIELKTQTTVKVLANNNPNTMHIKTAYVNQTTSSILSSNEMTQSDKIDLSSLETTKVNIVTKVQSLDKKRNSVSGGKITVSPDSRLLTTAFHDNKDNLIDTLIIVRSRQNSNVIKPTFNGITKINTYITTDVNKPQKSISANVLLSAMITKQSNGKTQSSLNKDVTPKPFLSTTSMLVTSITSMKVKLNPSVNSTTENSSPRFPKLTESSAVTQRNRTSKDEDKIQITSTKDSTRSKNEKLHKSISSTHSNRTPQPYESSTVTTLQTRWRSTNSDTVSGSSNKNSPKSNKPGGEVTQNAHMKTASSQTKAQLTAPLQIEIRSTEESKTLHTSSHFRLTDKSMKTNSTPVNADKIKSTPLIYSIIINIAQHEDLELKPTKVMSTKVHSTTAFANNARVLKLRTTMANKAELITSTQDSSATRSEYSVSKSGTRWLMRDRSHASYLFNPVCTLDVNYGVGSDTFSSWYYNEQSRQCEWFHYRGSDGNGNRFNYRANCENYCIEKQEDICFRLDLVQCEDRWLQCRMEHDTSCQIEAENDNKPSQLFCPPPQPICISKNGRFRKPPLYLTHRSISPEECRQVKDPGLCQKNSNSVLVFHYDSRYNDCFGFLYSKCGGNSNRFASKLECMNHCAF